MNNITLVQLVSGQAMPNLLAAMAIKPKFIVHIFTPSMTDQTKHLERAYRAAGLHAEVQTESLPDMPRISEMKDMLIQLADDRRVPVALNFTGGTKLMSMGAYSGALEKKMPSIYVDTDSGIFVDGHTSPNFSSLFQNGDACLSQVKRQLNVHTVAIANGCERVTAGKPWDKYTEMAELVLLDSKLEEACHRKANEVLKNVPRKFSEAGAYWRRQYKKPVRLPDIILELGTLSGLFVEKEGKYFLEASHLKLLNKLKGKPKMPDYTDALEAAAFPFAFFHGIWWEVAVMRWLYDQKKYRDLRWSVNVGSRDGGGTDMEEDILGVDDVNLLYVSCKRGGHKARLSRTVEDVNSSAQRIGGIFTKKVFAVCLPLSGQIRSRINNRCRELGIKLLDRDEVLRDIG